MTWIVPDWLIIIAGIGMMLTGFVYPFIRRSILNWFNDINKLSPINAAIARTYGYYIQGLNFLFGLFVIIFIEEMKNGSGLATGMSGLIAVYWTVRGFTQFLYYPIHTLTPTLVVRVGTIMLNLLILFLAVVFTWLFIWNLSGYLI